MAYRNQPFHQTGSTIEVTSGNGSSSAATAIGSEARVLRIRNRDGTNEVKFRLGNGTVAATANTSMGLAAGQTELFGRQGATHIACWGIGGAVIVEVTPGEGI